MVVDRVHGEVDRVDGEGAWWWTGWMVRVCGGGQGAWWWTGCMVRVRGDVW